MAGAAIANAIKLARSLFFIKVSKALIKEVFHFADCSNLICRNTGGLRTQGFSRCNQSSYKARHRCRPKNWPCGCRRGAFAPSHDGKAPTPPCRRAWLCRNKESGMSETKYE